MNPIAGMRVLLTRPLRSPLLGTWAGTVARGSGKRFGGAYESLVIHRCGFLWKTLGIT